VILLSI